MSLHRLLTGVVAVLSLPAVASADVLFTKTYQIDRREPNRPSRTVSERIGFGLGFSELETWPIPPSEIEGRYQNAILELHAITPADVGAIYTATRENDPDFAAAAAFLTNGVNDAVVSREEQWTKDLDGQDALGHEMIGLRFESVFFSRPEGAPDLAGYDLQSISLRFDSLQFIPFSDSTSEGKQVVGSYTLTFEGVAVPEPAALLLVPASVMLLCRRRR